jgi:hypothetical protein
LAILNTDGKEFQISKFEISEDDSDGTDTDAVRGKSKSGLIFRRLQAT